MCLQLTTCKPRRAEELAPEIPRRAAPGCAGGRSTRTSRPPDHRQFISGRGEWPGCLDRASQPRHPPHLRLVPLPHDSPEFVALLPPPGDCDGLDRRKLATALQGHANAHVRQTVDLKRSGLDDEAHKVISSL